MGMEPFYGDGSNFWSWIHACWLVRRPLTDVNHFPVYPSVLSSIPFEVYHPSTRKTAVTLRGPQPYYEPAETTTREVTNIDRPEKLRSRMHDTNLIYIIYHSSFILDFWCEQPTNPGYSTDHKGLCSMHSKKKIISWTVNGHADLFC